MIIYDFFLPAPELHEEHFNATILLFSPTTVSTKGYRLMFLLLVLTHYVFFKILRRFQHSDQ